MHPVGSETVETINIFHFYPTFYTIINNRREFEGVRLIVNLVLFYTNCQ